MQQSETARDALGARNTFDLLRRQAERAPEREAMVFLRSGDPAVEPVRLTRQEFLSKVARAASLFRILGVGPTDVVSILAPNVLDVQFAFWGAEAAGVVNPINFLLGADHIAEIMKAAGTKVLVTLAPEVAPPIWEKALAAQRLTPGLETIVVLGGHAPPGAYAFDALALEASADIDAWTAEKSPEDLAALFHTGGTTGAPKLVAHTHGNQLHAARATAESYAFTDKDAVMSGLPMFHVAGPILLTLAPLSAGARVVMATAAGNRDPLLLRNYWDIVEAHDATVVGGVPTSLADILSQGGAARAREDRICMTGGAQLSGGLQAQFEDATGIPVHQIYGMTETAGVICAAPRSERPPRVSVGRPARGVEVKVCKLGPSGERGQECAPLAPGAIFVRGANLSPGYYDRAAGLTPICDGDGWLATGDMGYQDADGWLYVTGRSKDVIIRSGHNIDPASIEEVARLHPDVVDAVAVGRPDLRAGEVPVVFVVLRPEASVDAAALKAFIIDHVSEAPAKPVDVILVPNLPMTAVGKVYRPALRAEAVRLFVEDAAREMFAPAARPAIAVDESCTHAIRLLIRDPAAPADGAARQRFRDWLAQHTFEHAILS